MKIEIASNDRVFIAGQTGTGKTYLAQELCKGFKRLVVIDTKGNLKSRFKLLAGSRKNIRRLERGYDLRLQVKPPILKQSELASYYDELFQELYEIGNVTVFIDELYSVVQSASTLPTYLNAIYTRGREVSKTGIISCVQRPMHIPLFVISESSHFFVFRLAMFDDRKKIANIIGDNVLALPEDKHGFYYYNYNIPNPVYVPSL